MEVAPSSGEIGRAPLPAEVEDDRHEQSTADELNEGALSPMMNRSDWLFAASRGVLRDERLFAADLDAGVAIEGLIDLREGILLYVVGRRAAVHPLPDPQARNSYFAMLKRHQMTDLVEPHLAPSHAVAARLPNRPIGLLWIDGDHSYEGVRQDFDDWFPRLPPGMARSSRHG